MAVERNGINVIAETERKGRPRDLFWPWCAANISVLGLAYGAYLLAFGVSFAQALLAGLAGIVFSFLLVGFVSLSGKRAGAPTMVVSRAIFGVRGNLVPTALSYVLLVGWEIVLTVTATLATGTVLERALGVPAAAAQVIGFVVVVAATVGVGVVGFDLVMRVQTWLTGGVALLTAGFAVLTAGHVHWDVVTSLPAGQPQAVVGAAVFAVTGFGLGWMNSGGDYSRYLPRTSRATGVVAWTTFGASLAPALLVLLGLLLVGSDPALGEAVLHDPVGALAGILPTWYLLPFALVAVAGLVGGTVLDIYSSGLTLLSLGVKVPRAVAVGVDGAVTAVGTVLVVWVYGDFYGAFQGFLTTLGVPIAAWGGIFLADQALRRRDLDEPALFDPTGRYGAVRVVPLLVLALCTAVGWGLVVNASAPWLAWQGYLLGPLGLGGRTGAWEYANLGVLVALGLALVLRLATGWRTVLREENA